MYHTWPWSYITNLENSTMILESTVIKLRSKNKGKYMAWVLTVFEHVPECEHWNKDRCIQNA